MAVVEKSSMDVLMRYSERLAEASHSEATAPLVTPPSADDGCEGCGGDGGADARLRLEFGKAVEARSGVRDAQSLDVIRTLNEEQASRLEKECVLKAATREEFGIGWKAEHIPSNAGRVSDTEDKPSLEGMCCLVVDEETGALGIDATVEPAAAVNLEYLSIALQVRSQEGREPFFSLDPVGADASMQEKRFEPEWLAGTSVGEVMFQADYHLKELSMGQYEQPVIGMKSCLDFADSEMRQKEWNAREWFVVKDADVLMSEDNVLMPYVDMGVEAREQIEGENGLIDAPLTKPDHPLVKYAELFTRNFDLIAERKSVVYNLRELAKASVLAKFLFESEVEMADSFFDLADAPMGACVLEIPQLWNERIESKLEVKDGIVLDAEKSMSLKMNGVYGGVQFGLDRFTVGARPATLSATVVGARGVAPRVSAALSMATSVTGGLRAPTMMRAASAMRAGVPSARAAVSMRAGGVARGVAFGLDRFTVGARPATLSATVVGARGVAPRVSAALSMATSVTGGLRAPTMMRAASAMRAGVPSARAAVSMRAGGVARGVAFGLDRFTVGARPATLSATVVGARGVAPRVSAALSMATSVTGGLRAPTMMRAASAMRAGVPSARAAVSMRAGGVARGVAFGLDRFTVGARPATLSATVVGARGVAPRVSAALSMATSVTGGLRAPTMMRAASAMRAGVPSARAAVSMRAGGVARGVDLNLDEFDLSEAGAFAGELQCDAGAPIGDAFWSCIDGSVGATFRDKDMKLFTDVYHASMSDRRAEGDLFVPLQTSAAYVQKLRCLVKQEDIAREEREQHFLSSTFDENDAGPLFPSSWKAPFQSAHASSEKMSARPEFVRLASEMLTQAGTPVFDRSAEDGMRFRTYRLGGIEVRTTMALGRAEKVGAVFSF